MPVALLLAVDPAPLAPPVRDILAPDGWTLETVSTVDDAAAALGRAALVLVYADGALDAARALRSLAGVAAAAGASLLALSDDPNPSRWAALFASGARDVVSAAQPARLVGRALEAAVAAPGTTSELRAAWAERRTLDDYRTLVERIADGVLMHRPDGSICFVNHAFASFVGRSGGELLGTGVLDLVHPDDREAIRGRIARVVLTGEPSPPRPVRFLCADGSVRFAETRSISVHFEGADALMVIARDLTERRRAEEALRLSEERFSRIFHASPAAFSITRLSDGTFLDVNERFVEVTGFSRGEVIGKTGTQLGMWPDPKARAALYEAGRRDGRVRNVEVTLRNRSGERVDVVMSTEMVQLGGEMCLLALARDITEQKRLDEQLRHAQKMEAMGRLAGGIAHDFNNLLTGIRGYSELLVAQLPKDGSAHDAAMHIHRAALRAAGLTGQLLLFTRRQPTRTEVLVLDVLVQQLGSLLRRIIGGDISLELHLEAPLGAVRVDAGQIEQLVLNLAVNARDAMPDGGRLTLATALTTDESGRPSVRLSVSDTGSGMSEEVRSHIFEPFFTTKEIGRGTGLGLSIVYSIVEQAGGHITVDTAVGKGSTFHIVLPRVIEVARPTDVEPPRKGPGGHELILLVEDDEDVREWVQLVLERAGYQVLLAKDGAEALEQVQAQADRIRLVLTDVVMPKMNGRELVQRLGERLPGLRSMYMSGYPGTGFDDDGHVAFLRKPFSAEELLHGVRRLLDAA